MNRKSRRLAWLAAVVALLSLDGCSTIPSAGIDRAENLPADGGLVAVQVVTNSQKLSDALPNWSEVLVVDKDRTGPDGKPLIYSLPALNDGLSSTRAFVGVLRPGRYRFGGLFAVARTGDSSRFQSAPAPATVGAFEVRTEHLTNLGTVLLQPFLGDPLASPTVGTDTKFAYAMSRLDDAISLEDFVARRYPTQYARIRGRPALGWLPDSLAPLRERLAETIRAHAVLSEPHFDKTGGEIYYTARLGTLYRRDGSGHWFSAYLPTRYDLIGFAKLPDGSLVAGGERGGIWRAQNFDGAWQPVPLDDREQTVVWLGAVGDAHLCAITSTGDRYRLYRTPLSGPWRWQLVGEYGKHDAVDDDWRVFALEHTPAVIPTPDGIRLFGPHSSHRFDAGSGNLLAQAGFGTTDLVNQPNGITVAMPYSGWSGTKPPQVSRDHGGHWEQFHRLGQFHERPYVFEDGAVLGTDNDSSFALFGWKRREKVDVLISADKGVTHTTAGQLAYGCGLIEAAISTDALLFARCFDGTLLTSGDRGRTWTRESSRSVRPDKIPKEFLTGTLSPVDAGVVVLR